MSEIPTTEVEAIMAASGHTEADAKLIVSELRKAGWLLIKPTWGPALTASPSREAPKGYTIA
jgi:hypothetical protein